MNNIILYLTNEHIFPNFCRFTCIRDIFNDKNMCLFLIKSKKNLNDGIIGVKLEKKKIEIYFVLKLNKNSIMSKSLKKIILFLRKNYKIKNFIVKVFSNNLRAKKLYFNQGFQKYKKNYLSKQND